MLLVTQPVLSIPACDISRVALVGARYHSNAFAGYGWGIHHSVDTPPGRGPTEMGMLDFISRISRERCPCQWQFKEYVIPMFLGICLISKRTVLSYELPLAPSKVLDIDLRGSFDDHYLPRSSGIGRISISRRRVGLPLLFPGGVVLLRFIFCLW